MAAILALLLGMRIFDRVLPARASRSAALPLNQTSTRQQS